MSEPQKPATLRDDTLERLQAKPVPRLHLTIRERSGGVLAVEIPRTHRDQAKFAAGTPVVISLEDDPAIRVRARVWGRERRFATIRQKTEHAERFEVGKDVTVVREADGEPKPAEETEKPAVVFYADVLVGAGGRAHIEVPDKRKADFPAGTTVRVEVVL